MSKAECNRSYLRYKNAHDASKQPVDKDTNVPINDSISRRSAIDVLHGYFDGMLETDTVCPADIYGLFACIPSAQPERMTNRQWIDFLSAQFDISRTSAKEMLHGMMRWKKEDNFKKMFNGGKT